MVTIIAARGSSKPDGNSDAIAIAAEFIRQFGITQPFSEPAGGWFADFAQESIENKRRYCEKHGYGFFVENDLLNDINLTQTTLSFERFAKNNDKGDRIKKVSMNVERKPSWLKVKAVERHLNSGEFDWVFWIDGDTVIMNYDVRLESFLPSSDGEEEEASSPNTKSPHLIITKDHRGINAGVWLIKRSDWSLKFLHRWWSLSLKERFLKKYRMKRATDTIGRSGDQDAMTYILSKIEQGALWLLQDSNNNTSTKNDDNNKTNATTDHSIERVDSERRYVAYLPQCSFNSYFEMKSWYGVYMKGDFLCHFAGHYAERSLLMKAFINGYIYDYPGWV